MSEEEGCGMELPTSATPNCEVVEVEDEEQGGSSLCLVACRRIRSGEFLCIAEDDD